MFSSEEGAYSIIEDAISKYEEHFDLDFPIYEYIHITKNDHYDFSVAGAKKLGKFIDQRIEKNDPVNVPEDYYERRY